ncbi:MAG: pyridoxal phosphate-dependent aminotransferase [Lentisphaerae bacterium]|nr:pyridoxal phosphate-dependent aminotransferase [Lentisphaerota bacterium]
MSGVVTQAVREQMANASWIRRMFEAGIELKQKVGAENVFDFSLGNPDVPAPARAREVLLQIAEQAVKPLGLGYCPNAGLPATRAALARKLSQEQCTPVTAADVVVTCGAAGALTAFFRAVLDPGDEVIVPAPYFVEYGAYCGHFGGVLRPVPSRPPDFQLDVPALAAAIGPRTRVVLINSPNNPAGCIYAREALQTLADEITTANAGRERPIFLVSDEPYRALAYDGAVVPPVLPLTPDTVVVGSFSKSLALAGERVGYLLVNPAMPDARTLLDAVVMTNRTLGFVNAPVIGQALVKHLVDEHVDVTVYDARRREMARVLRAAGIPFALPQGAFYFFAEAPGGDDLAFVKRLLEQNILAVPGRGFGCPGYFRLSFSVAIQTITASADAFVRATRP